MKKMNKILTTVLVIALAALTLAGCAKKDASPVTTDGSTSMEKVIGTLGEAFKEKEGIDVTYNPTGSGSGIQAVSEGRCDIGLSSRALKDDEKATLTETTVALDGIAMIVNPENPVSDLTVEQIADISIRRAVSERSSSSTFCVSPVTRPLYLRMRFHSL